MKALADLHRHLDGSLRPSTLAELARTQQVEVPQPFGFTPGMGLDQALALFSVTLSVLGEPAAVQRVASEMCEDAADNGVTTLEIRFAPQLHKGAAMSEIIAAACDGAAGRAGIILCGLYGDSPELVKELAELGAAHPGVVGLDLAGGPSSSHDWSLEDYREAFTRARDLGLGRTVHAGEGRPPREIAVAIETLHAQRIGHGTTLLDDPKVLDLVLQRDIVIEACPTSNVHTGVIPEVAAHPLSRWLDLGVKVCLCTDNTLLSAVTAPEELERVRGIPGMNDSKLGQLIENGHAAAFPRRS